MNLLIDLCITDEEAGPLGWGDMVEVIDDLVEIRAFDEVYDPETGDEDTIRPLAYEGRWDAARGVFELRSVSDVYGWQDVAAVTAAANELIRRHRKQGD